MILRRILESKTFHENEVPANAAGTGAVAAIGVGPDGEPGVNKKKKKNSLTFGGIFTRGKVGADKR